MADIEPLKPSNTGWLIADVLPNTFAFGWARTEVPQSLLALLADPQWQPYVVFPAEYAAHERVLTAIQPPHQTAYGAPFLPDTPTAGMRRPLFVLLDGTWAEARKMFRKSPYTDHLPVLSLQPEQLSRYRLRRSHRSDHLCTAEVAALCLDLAGDHRAAQTLEAYLDVFTQHYLHAKNQWPIDLHSDAHQHLIQTL